MNINDNEIRNAATNMGVYLRGCQMTDKVSNFKFDNNKNAIYGLVEDTCKYNVCVEFSRGVGGIESYQCQCGDFFSNDGACKHVIALLETAKEKFDSNFKTVITDVFLPFPFEGLGNRKKRKVRLWLDQYLENEERRGAYLNLKLKVGEKKPYVIKDITDFLNTVAGQNMLHLTRNYELNFNEVFFDGVDKEVIDFLTDLLRKEEKQARFLRPYYRFYTEEYSIFQKNSVRLFEDNLKRYLEIIKDAGFSLIFNGRELGNMVVAGDLEMDVNVEEKGTEILVNADYSKDVKIMALTDDYEYVLDPYTAKVYRIEEPKRKLIESIHDARLNKNRPVFKIQKEERGIFLKRFLPEIEKTSNVKISDDLREKLANRILTAKIYFDSEQKGISARVEFCYGDKTISPGSTAVDQDVIMRDYDSENRVLEFLKSTGMVQKGGLYHSESEEDIVELLSGKIEGLKDLAEVYYSEAFKAIQIRSVSRVQMGIRLNSDSNLLECDFQIDDFDDSELLHLLSSVRERKKYYRLKNGSIIKLDNRELVDLSMLLKDLDVDEKRLKNSRISLPSNRALFIDNYVKEKEFKSVRKNEDFDKLVREILNPSNLEFKLDNELQRVLRDYQKFGYKWMKTLSHYGFGGILADDMGLGKTLQVLAFVKSENESVKKPSMVVAPTSLIYNWKAEVEKFVPDLKVAVITGTKAERAQQIENIGEHDIAVTSFGSLKRDIDLYEGMDFLYVFVDEAQHIKNPSTLNAGSVKSLKSRGCFALTGTPIENNLTELWSIFDFIMPGYLMSHHKFSTKFESPIIKNNDKKALKALSAYIKPFILRRLKQEVLKELPEKIETKVVADLTGEQKKLYAAYLKSAQGEIAAEIKDKGVEKSKIKILALLTRLRQLCCHPATFIDNYKGGSGKLETLMEILEVSTGSGHRVLLFSQFTSMLKIIEKELDKNRIGYFYLDGSTSAEDRINMVNSFNEGEKSVFLISLKAGGTGLNLTGADVVIHFDPWWNPSVEDQATDRAYRIGQTKAVQVYKIVARGTIEERILELQGKKKGLINSVIKAGENLITKLSEKEIRDLFQMD